MKPLIKYIGDLLARFQILGTDHSLGSRVEAETLLNQLVSDRKVPGMAISVLKDGLLFYQKGFGHARIESDHRIDPGSTLFRAASASKPIAATALAKMIKERIIDLDAPFHHYVPYFPKKEYEFTIRQLASHTAGIRGYKGKEYALNKPYSIKESLVVFQNDPLLFRPGTAYLYNSFDWVLVSLAMQEASGLPFEAYVKEKVLNPLGMRKTKPEIPNAEEKDQAWFYTKRKIGFKKAVEVDNRYKLAGGGYLSTSADLVRLGQSYLDFTFLDPQISSQFLTPSIIDGKSTYYGLGWEVSTHKEGHPYFGHTGNSIGGYSNFYVYPENKMVVAILINCTDPKIQHLLDHIISIWLGKNTRAEP
ncbi:MAG: serine hydrolase domain-containing protein [Flavobacteriaceae bacterium]